MRANGTCGVGVAVALLAMCGCEGSSRRGAGAATPGAVTITASAGAGGTIAPTGAVAVAPGGSQTFTFTPDAGGFTLADVIVDGVSQGPIATYTFTGVTTGHTIAATFHAPIPLTVTAGAGGTITPCGDVLVPRGATQTFTIVADAGFAVADVVVDGVSQGAIPELTLTDVTAPHTIAVTFSPLPSTAVVKLRTEGTLPQGTLIGGVQVTLTHATDKGLSIQGGDVVAAGAAAGALLVANANTAGRVVVALVHAAGLGTGEFACATFTVSPPNVAAPADFALAPGAQVIDLNGVAIPGIAVAIAAPDVL